MTEDHEDLSPESPDQGGLDHVTRGASFKSLSSYASFRSCRTYRSMGGMSRISYKSCISRNTKGEAGGVDNPVFYDSKDDEFETGSYYSVCDNERPPAIMEQTKSEESSEGSQLKKEDMPPKQVYLGYVFSILAGITFTASNVLIKLVPSLDPWSILLFRATLQLVIMIPVLIYSKSNPLGPRGNRIGIYMQGIVGGVLLLGIFLAVKRVPLGDCAAIFFSAPAFTLILSCLVLREHLRLYRSLITLFLLSGVVLLSRPSFIFQPSQQQEVEIVSDDVTNLTSSSHADLIGYHRHLVRFNVLGWPVSFNKTHDHNNMLLGALPPPDSEEYDVIGVIAAVSVPILSAYLVILTRQCREAHYSVLVFWFGLGALCVSLVGVFTLGNPQLFQSAQDWVLACLIAVLGIAGNILMTQALKWVAPGKVMVLRSFEIVAAYILQICVFNTTPVWLDLGGTVLVMMAVLLMGTEDIIMRRFPFRFL